MVKKLGIIILLFSQSMLFAASEIPRVPARMDWCGMELTFTPQARDFMNDVIAKLHKSEVYFQSLVDRANTFMPFVEQAFQRAGVPDDLKYIVLQESALIGDAVSKSNAVGFWQFKDFTAREVGLRVNDEIDERKHIYRSSVGAALYFHRLNKDFDNWLYAVIGYNRGPTGAIPYTDADYYGERKMLISANTHWYALKAIAHKIAFQDELGKNPAGTWLEPARTRYRRSVGQIAKDYEIETNKLREYNLWILGEKLPQSDFLIFIPRKGNPVRLDDIHFFDTIPEPPVVAVDKPNDKPEVKEWEPERPPRSNYTSRRIFEDPDYGSEFVVFFENGALVELAVRHNKSLKKIREWNDMGGYERPPAGTVLRMVPKKKAKYHIVMPGETLGAIAVIYGIKESKLKKLNAMDTWGEKVYPGQKLYLKKAKPSIEKIIILEWDMPVPEEFGVQDENVPEQTMPPEQTEESVEVIEVDPMKTEPLPEYETRMIWHTVAAGETLWSISQKYDTKVDIIKKLNEMDSNAISPGQKLKVMERVEK